MDIHVVVPFLPGGELNAELSGYIILRCDVPSLRTAIVTEKSGELSALDEKGILDMGVNGRQMSPVKECSRGYEVSIVVHDM